LKAVSDRFRDRTIPLFEKHGIRQAGFWTTAIGESNLDLIYLLEWDSLAEREERWTAFGRDPEWHTVVAETEADGPLIANISSQIMVPTSYSAHPSAK